MITQAPEESLMKYPQNNNIVISETVDRLAQWEDMLTLFESLLLNDRGHAESRALAQLSQRLREEVCDMQQFFLQQREMKA